MPELPVRIVHLGLGAFHRSHQAYFTDLAGDAWGIAAFTGRSPQAAAALAAQDGRFTLLTRGPEHDEARAIESIVAAHDGADRTSWSRYFASPDLAVVTMTVTEEAYVGAPDDVIALQGWVSGDEAPMPQSAIGRLVAGLLVRRRADLGPIAIAPCDNLLHNGSVVADLVDELAALVDPTLLEWMAGGAVSYVSSVVDRITPRTTPDDIAAAARITGVVDPCTVVTEPFAEWIFAGEFPAGRPAWDRVGAKHVANVASYERRKVFLLNGAHSLLAYYGAALGHKTVADAIADTRCRQRVEAWWDEACPTIDLPDEQLAGYRTALLDRFANPRLRHSLAQISSAGLQKLQQRVVPIARDWLAERRGTPEAAAFIIGAWIAQVCPAADIRGGVAALAPDLADDDGFVAAVADATRTVTAQREGTRP